MGTEESLGAVNKVGIGITANDVAMNWFILNCGFIVENLVLCMVIEIDPGPGH